MGSFGHMSFWFPSSPKTLGTNLDSVLGVEEFKEIVLLNTAVSYTNIKGFIGSGVLPLEMGSYGFLLTRTLKADWVEMSRPTERRPCAFC